jgi:parallel beta-helix repeat protein
MKKLEALAIAIILFSMTTITSASPDIITVGPSGADYTSIQDAVNDARDGDKIEIWNGTYYEHVVVNKPLTIYARDGASSTVVNGDGNGTIFYVTTDNVTIENFTVMNGDYGIFIRGNSSNVTDNIVKNNNKNGIRLESSNYLTIKGNDIKTNGIGIYLNASNYTIIDDNEVISNNGTGISAYTSRNCTITNNTMNSNDYQGIRLETSEFNTISDNTANSNRYYGICLVSSNDNTISSNTAKDSKQQSGILLYGESEYNTVSNNIVSLNYKYGIYLVSSNDNTISNNTARSNKRDGIYLTKSDDNIIICNILNSNEDDGIQLSSSNDNTLKDNIVNANKDYGIVLLNSNDEIINNTVDSNRGGIWMGGSCYSVITDCTIRNSTYTYFDLYLKTNSSIITLNTTFDGDKVSCDNTSKLTVENYLEVKVVDVNGTSISGANISVKDGNETIYESQTDEDGLCSGIVVTDRVYNGNSTATEHITTVYVTYDKFHFDDNSRDADMSTSHTEIFKAKEGL